MSHDRNSGEPLLAQLEINGNGVTYNYIPLNDCPQTTDPKVEADAPGRPHTTTPQVTNRDGDGEQSTRVSTAR